MSLANTPYPVRLWDEDDEALTKYSKESGVPKAELVRRLVHHGLRLVVNGKMKLPSPPVEPVSEKGGAQ